MAHAPWWKLTPSKKQDVISEVYEQDNTTASDLVVRLNQKFGIVVSRNMIIGTYGRSEELRSRYPLTGTSRSKPTANAESRRLDEEARANREKIKAERAELKAEADRLRKIELAKKKQASEKASAEAAFRIESRVGKRQEFEDRQSTISAKRAAITCWETTNCVGTDIHGLGSGICRWPISNGQPHRFCGNHFHVSGSRHVYCSYHSRLATDSIYDGVWDG